MPDRRLQQLAKLLVNYSLHLKAGERFGILAKDTAAPLIKEVYREALRVGALVKVEPIIDGLSEILYEEGNDEQLSVITPMEQAEVEYYDATLTIWAEQNTRSLSGIDPSRISIRQKARSGLFKREMEREGRGETRWCGTLFPTHASAQDAGMSLTAYENFVFEAGLLHQPDPIAAWRQVYAEQQRVADFLAQHDEIHIVAPGTDLTYRVGGRTWINCAGTQNFPDGEVFTGPIEDSVNGTVAFSYPAFYNGNEVEGVRLTFRDGKIIEATASRNLEFLNAMLETDPGARFLGEVAFGLNYQIQRFTKMTLFDEKIGGTMHMAIGASIPASGGVNESAIHWDMVNSLQEGQVYADGQLCYEKGRFIL